MKQVMRQIAGASALTVVCLAAILAAGCGGTKYSERMPRGEVSEEWAAAAEDFYNDAMAVQAPHIAQPYSIMAVDHGKVVFEQWYNGHTPSTTMDVQSISKTVIALATGFAVQEGLFGVEDRVIDFFPDHLPGKVSDTLATMTIAHLLTMTCGMEESPKLLAALKPGPQADFDWIGEFFASRQTSMPGTDFYYNFFAPYIVAAIIQKTSGMRILDYLRPRLLEPLHITDMEWHESPAGICIAGWGMFVCTEDIAKIGQLLLQKGEWNGKQLIPAQWVATMTSKLVESRPANAFIKRSNPDMLNDPENEHSFGYGYYVWQGKHGTCRMEGMGGQYAFINLGKGIVLVITSNTDLDKEYQDLIWKHFSRFM